jgi:hypothetical protein
MNILNTKEEERKKELEKAERDAAMGKKVHFEQEEEEKKMTLEEQIMKKRMDEKLSISNTSHFSEMQREKEREKQEILKYGVNKLILVNRFMNIENVDMGRILPP